MAAGLLAACATVAAPALRQGERWHREANFCLALAPDETIERVDPGSDFILYRYRRGDETVVIYEGNYPQPGGVVLQTGFNFPSVISIHGDEAFARRFLIGEQMSVCG